MAVIRQKLKQHRLSDDVIDMSVKSIRDSSFNVYNSHWRLFIEWADTQNLPRSDLSYPQLMDYLIHLFMTGRQVNTIKVHRSSITSALRLVKPPSPLEEETLSNIIRAMSIQRPRQEHILPKWRLSVVLKSFFKPPFTDSDHGSDRHIPLEFLTYKTAFLVALASAARGSELMALSRADHHLQFTELPSGAKRASIQLMPKFLPKNATPDVIPKPVVFPGIAHLFPREQERLLCPVRALGLYLVKSHELASQTSTSKLFVHFKPGVQVFSTHFRHWITKVIQMAYDGDPNLGEISVNAHEVRAIAASVAYYRHTPLPKLRQLIGWKSEEVFAAHYLRDMAVDQDLDSIPLVAAGIALY